MRRYDNMAEKKKHWMKKAFSNAHGQFRAKAEAAGKSTAAYAREHEHDSGKLGKQARLAEVGMKMAKHKHHSASSRKIMHSMYGGKGE